MSDNKVTLDQLDNSAVEAMSKSVGNVNMLNTENKTIVGALAEIVGKKEIANAIGEPLAETDKFTEMSSEINGLLSTFKTNMMNAGVVVESGDKFKALIDKIKGLTEGEGNKGVQFTSGLVTTTVKKEHTYTLTEGGEEKTFKSYDIELTFDFEPSIIYVYNKYTITTVGTPANYESVTIFDALEMQELFIADIAGTGVDIIKLPHLIEDGKYYMPITDSSASALMPLTSNESYWYAIGVGEEDTTLRDSLADILENKGVEVTEEDDMAGLISKVDDMTSNMIKYKSGIHEHTFDGNTRISFEVTGIGFRPTFVQICRVNKTQTDGGYQFWINNAYMYDSNSIYIPVESIWNLKSTSYTGLGGTGVNYNEIVVNDDGFSLNIITGGTSGDLWHFEWFVLG